MSNLPSPILYNFEQNEIPIYMDPDNNPWLLLNVVCSVIGLTRTSDVISRLDDDEYCEIESIGANNNTIKKYLINEAGFYSTVLRSNKPEAKRFKRWITHDVLPSIRKTGMYKIPQQNTQPAPQPTQFNVPQNFLEALELCVELERKRLVLEEQNAIMKPKAEFYDVIIEDNSTWSINDVAKMLSIPNFGQRKLFEHLREQKIFMWNNLPYQQYMNQDFFKVVQVSTTVGAKSQTRVTQRGVNFIVRNLIKFNIIKGSTHAEISGGKLALVDFRETATMCLTSSTPM